MSNLKLDINSGFREIKQKDTWKRVGALAGGSLLGSVAVMLTNKLTKDSSKVLSYGGGALSSGVISVVALGMGYENVGMGSAMVAAGQALNTATSLVFDKSVAELISKA